jgi:hypothetical protein
MATPFVLAPASPPLLQSANAFFLAAALFADVLLVRFFLSLAFICLLTATLLSTVETHVLMIDSIAWLLVTGVLHWRAAWVLIREELPPPPLADADDSALFWFLQRRTGMGRRDFDRLRAVGTWRRFAAGEQICETTIARRRLHVMVEGRASLSVRYEGADEATATSEVGSGDCFDLRLLNVCGVYLGFPNAHFVARGHTDCVCFTVELDALERLVRRHTQFVGFLRSFALAQLARLAQRMHAHALVLDAFGHAEDAEWARGARSRDFEPLRTRELEGTGHSLRATIRWLTGSLAPWVQPGMRHRSDPLSGSLAQATVRSQSVVGLRDLLEPREVAVPLVAHQEGLGL